MPVKTFQRLLFCKPRTEKNTGNGCVVCIVVGYTHTDMWIPLSLYIYINTCNLSMSMVISKSMSSLSTSNNLFITSSKKLRPRTSIFHDVSRVNMRWLSASFLSWRRIWTEVLRQWTAKKGLDCSTCCMYLSTAYAGGFLSGDPLNTTVVYQLINLFSSYYFNSPCCLPSRISTLSITTWIYIYIFILTYFNRKYVR